MTVHIRDALGQRAQCPTFLVVAIDRPFAQRPVQSHTGPPLGPAVELLLEVERPGKLPTRLEARLQELDEPLDHAFRLGVAWRA